MKARIVARGGYLDRVSNGKPCGGRTWMMGAGMMMGVGNEEAGNRLGAARDGATFSISNDYAAPRPYAADKLGSAVPSSAISNAFSKNEEKVISEQTLSLVDKTAAEAVLMKPPFWSRTWVRIAAVILGVAIVIGGIAAYRLTVMNYQPMQPTTLPAQQAQTTPPTASEFVQQPVAQQQAVVQEAVQGTTISAEVVSSDPNIKTSLIIKDQDVEAWKTFQAQQSKYRYVSEEVTSGYRFTTYMDADTGSAANYYIIIEQAIG